MPDAALKDALIFDPSNRGWVDITAGLDLAQTRMGHGITSSGDKIYVYGGMVSGVLKAAEFRKWDPWGT
jgi:hypothetical protein